MRLFLSYAHDDYDPMVRRLKADLEGLGHEVWIDRERISDWQDPTHDSDWRSSVTRGVLGSDLVLSFASARALRDNGVCLDELQISACVKGALVQSVLLEPGASALVPPAASFRQFVDMGDWREKLTRGDDEFEAWYADRLAELTTRLDGEELRRYAAELEEVERLLDPGLSTAKQDALQAAGFVGRGWLAKEVDAWLDDGDASQVMLVTGTPGCGKSAFAAHELMYDCRVGAAVFCQYDNAAFNDIDGVARAAAFQLAARFPDYRTTLLETLRREEGHRARRDEPRDGGPFERYVEAISRNLIRGGRGNVVIVIDGLDEVAMEGSGPRAVNPLAEELGGLIREGGVPRFVRFLVTSRADAAVVDSLTMARRLDVDAHPEEGEADVRAYVEARVGREGPLCEEIAAGAETNFQYARVACDLAGHGAFEAAAVPRSLGGLYRLYLDRAFGEAGAQPDASAPSEKAPEVAGDASQEEANHKNARRDKGMRKNRKALCLIASMDEPVPRETLRRAMGWGRRDEGCFRRALGMFLSETPDGRVSLFHKSFSDWLWTDEADVYRCDPDEGRELALGACIASFRDDAGGMSRFEATNLLPLLRESGEAHADDLREALGSEGLAERLVELSGDGRLSERVLCLQGALSIYRSLAADNPKTILPFVAWSCFDLEIILHDSGNLSGAEALGREALAIFRTLADSNPGVFLPDVAGSCNNLVATLLDLGNLAGAETLGREALATYRTLAESDSKTYLPHMARSCRTLAAALNARGDLVGAENLEHEALETYRQLAEIDPGAYMPDVAWSCDGLAISLANHGNLAGAEALEREALAIQRRLDEANPGVYAPDVARSCDNLSTTLLERGDLAGAEALGREALATYKRLDDADPGAFTSDVARSSSNLVSTLRTRGDLAGAETLGREALATYKRLDDADPGAFTSDVARSSINLAAVLYERGDLAGAEALGREALATYRLLVESDPGGHAPDMARSCDILAVILSERGELANAEALEREALATYRQLTEADPRAYAPDIARSCDNLAAILHNCGNLEGAETLRREALGTFRQLAETDPGAFSSDVARECDNLVSMLWKRGDLVGAETFGKEALATFRQLAKADPETYMPDVAWSCSNLAIILADRGDLVVAETLMKETLAVYQSLADACPGTFLPEVALSYSNLAIAHYRRGDLAGAETSAGEALKLYKRLAENDSTSYSHFVEGASNLLARIRGK